MERREFLSFVGVGAAVAACTYCLSGCTAQDQGITAPTNIDFTLDLTNQAYSALNAVGGYVYNSGVIDAHTSGGYVAVSSACTHQGNTIVFDKANNSFYCPAHGSRFSTAGAVINGPASSPLGKYNTAVNGNSLHVYS